MIVEVLVAIEDDIGGYGAILHRHCVCDVNNVQYEYEYECWWILWLNQDDWFIFLLC